MLPRTPRDLERLLAQPEGPSLECKEAKGSFNDDKLRRYLCALANEGGGHVILGVTDKRPRRVVGSRAFPNVQADVRRIRESLRPPPSVEAVEITHSDGRVVVFEVGSRARGQVVRFERVRWVRDGESLTDMDDARLRQILLEQTDVTAEPCPDARLRDLDPEAIGMAVRMAEPLPAFVEPEGRRVLVTLFGSPDMDALPIMRRVPSDTWPELTAAELRTLDAVRRGLPRTAIHEAPALRLVERGLIEPGGPGGAAFSFAAALRSATGDAPLPAVARVVLQLEGADRTGMSLRELDAALTDTPTSEIRRALRWLRRNGSAYTTGRTKGTRWHLPAR